MQLPCRRGKKDAALDYDSLSALPEGALALSTRKGQFRLKTASVKKTLLPDDLNYQVHCQWMLSTIGMLEYACSFLTIQNRTHINNGKQAFSASQEIVQSVHDRISAGCSRHRANTVHYAARYAL